MMRNSRMLLGWGLVLAVGCSTAQVRVLPGENGVNRVVSRDIERDDAEAAALKQAEKFCKKRNQTLVIVQEEKTQYEGSMDEENRRLIRNASKVATVLGGPAGVATDRAGVGGVVSGAGAVGYGMTSDRDYKAELLFKCQ